jgi:UPF0755 protein
MAAGAAVLLLGAVGALAWWVRTPTVGDGKAVTVFLPAEATRAEQAALLVDAGLTDDRWRLRFLLAIAGPFVRVAPGEHVLVDDLSPAELLRRLGRLSSRERVRVAIPEGFNQFQIAQRLEDRRVCGRGSFLAASADSEHLLELGVRAPDAEGYLFPATYELFTDSEPRQVVDKLVREGVSRIRALTQAHAARMQELDQRYGWSERDAIALASVVEKEAKIAEERRLIAGVFFNRLDDPDFRPRYRLQSDPPAGYGCLKLPDLASCRRFKGRILPEMLRDEKNPYNTYKRAGLPPGPIANPGASSIEAVLDPAKTEYLFFYAAGGGRHTFSKTLTEHEAAIGR